MSNTVKVKSVKVYVEHCESKVREGVCRTLYESKVCGSVSPRCMTYSHSVRHIHPRT